MRARGIWIAAAVVFVLMVGAWALEYLTDPGRGEEAPRTAAAYAVRVVAGDTVVSTFTTPQLKALGVRRVKMQGQWEEGPTVVSVLDAAGIEEYSSVRFVGMKIRDGGELTLDRARVDEDVLLDIAVRGTAKICGPDIAREDRVRDIVRIEVAP